MPDLAKGKGLYVQVEPEANQHYLRPEHAIRTERVLTDKSNSLSVSWNQQLMSVIDMIRITPHHRPRLSISLRHSSYLVRKLYLIAFTRLNHLTSHLLESPATTCLSHRIDQYHLGLTLEVALSSKRSIPSVTRMHPNRPTDRPRQVTRGIPTTLRIPLPSHKEHCPVRSMLVPPS